jgi:hypothetical protein
MVMNPRRQLLSMSGKTMDALSLRIGKHSSLPKQSLSVYNLA